MVMNSYLLYNENYRESGKLKSRYNYIVSIIKSFGEVWLVLKANAGAMTLGDHEDSENSLKRKSPNALPSAQRRVGGEP
jgi:hypothetical protein